MGILNLGKFAEFSGFSLNWIVLFYIIRLMAEAEVSIEEIEKARNLLKSSQHMREIYVPGGL